MSVTAESPSPVRSPEQRGYLDVRDLKAHFATEDGVVRAVDGISFSVDRGETLAIVGESGSGKSVTSLTVMGLNRGRTTTVSGSVFLDGEDLVAASAERVRQLRGAKMSMIFQDPLSSLHPFYTVGAQIAEAYRAHHKGSSRKVAKKRAVDMLGLVGIPEPTRRVDDYPHQFSGGMRQRAMIAMSLVNDPALLIADEPTTALDVTVQAQILALIAKLREEFNSAVVMITHDLGVVAEVADKVLVMYAGKAVETGSVREVFNAPEHPYTFGLLGSMTRLDVARTERLKPIPGAPPSLIDLPTGCSFRPRCQWEAEAEPANQERTPPLEAVAGGSHKVACWLSPERRREIWTQEVRSRA